MFNLDRFQDIKQKLKRRALPLAFLFGFLASLIAVDPFSNQGMPVLRDSQSNIAVDRDLNSSLDSLPADLSAKSAESSLGPSLEPSLGASVDSSAGSSVTNQESTSSVDSIGGIDGVSEAGSAHPFDRAFPRQEAEIDAQTSSSGGDVARRPASAQAWDGEDSLQNLRFDDNEPLWNGKAQLLPNPMFVEQLTSKRMKAIRGGGWMAIDLARGEIWPVELFKSTSVNFTSRAVIEAKVVRLAQNGQGRVLNTVNTGIPVVRGISGIVPGTYEVPETPACLVRYSVVTKEEVCSAMRPRSAGGAQIRFRFEPPVASSAIAEDGSVDPLSEDGDFQFTTVYVESQNGKWLEIGTFNESFTPIGDANRDGFPDFYLESLSDSSSGGRHDLLISSPSGDGVVYTTYSARFIGR
jgi:hypothetical protein